MRSDWQTIAFGDVAEIRHGFAFKTRFATDTPSEYALFTRKNIVPGGGFREETPRYYDGPIDSRFVLTGGEVMVVLTDLSKGGDLLGFPGRVPRLAPVRYLHNQRVGRVEFTNAEVACPDFLYWVMCSPGYRDHVLRTASQTTVLDTAPSRLHAFRFSIPPLPEQRRIAAVLRVLDDKIQHNRLLSKRLADVASAFFAAEREAWTNGDRAVLASIAAPVRDLVAPGTGGGEPYIGLDLMPRGSPVLTEWLEAAAPLGQSVRFNRGDVLFGKLRPYFKKVGVAPIDGRASTEVLVLRPRDDLNWGVLVGYVTTDAFIEHCVSHSTGTKMPRAEWKDAGNFPVTSPTPDQAREVNSFMRPIHELIVARTHESRRLMSLRDMLLPKLISGQMQVPDSSDPDDVPGAVAEGTGAAA